MVSVRLGLFVVLAVVLGLVSRNATRSLPLEKQDLDGRVFIVTGASAGIGVETTRILVDWGATVVLACRNTKKAQKVVDDVEASTKRKGSMHNWELDLSSFKSVRAFAGKFKESGLPLHGLINNAGMVSYESLRYTEDDLELTFQTNHLGQFLLTDLLLENLKQSAPSRVVNVASDAHKIGEYGSDPSVLNTTFGAVQYGRTKLCNVLFSNELNRRLVADGYKNVVSNSLHPGVILTEFLREVPDVVRVAANAIAPFFFRSIEDGAKTTVHAATHPSLETVGGLYFVDGNQAISPIDVALDETVAKALWEYSARLVGVTNKN